MPEVSSEFFGIGTDLVEVERMAKSLLSPRFIQEIFGDEEREYCLSVKAESVRIQRFAARFAAKEAFLKAIGRGILEGIDLKDIQVVHEDDTGRPSLRLGPTALCALQLVTGKKICDGSAVQVRTFVTLSHVSSMATATVVVQSK